jgi:cell division protease FtsH
MIDSEVRSIIDARLEQVLHTLREHEDLLHLVAERLLTKETIESEEFLELIGRKAEAKTAVGTS